MTSWPSTPHVGLRGRHNATIHLWRTLSPGYDWTVTAWERHGAGIGILTRLVTDRGQALHSGWPPCEKCEPLDDEGRPVGDDTACEQLSLLDGGA